MEEQIKKPADQTTTSTCSIGVYVTTKNRRAMLERALTSVLNQTVKPDEIIVIDDGSDDDTPEYLKLLEAREPSLKVITNSESLGACGARNLAIKSASTCYLTGLDDDDEFTPDRLQNFKRSASLLSEGISALTTHMVQQRPMITVKRKLKRKITLTDMLFKNHAGNQVFTKTSRLRAINGFDEKLPAMQDYDTWIRLMEAFGPIQTLDTFSYVLHLDHSEPRITDTQRREAAARIFYRKHKRLMSRDHEKAEALYAAINANKKITFQFVLDNYSKEMRSELIKYYLTSNYKIISTLKQKIFG